MTQTDNEVDALTLALAMATGGDPQLLDGLRRIAWDGYVAAGQPYGLEEEGMKRWWREQMGARLGQGGSV